MAYVKGRGFRVRSVRMRRKVFPKRVYKPKAKVAVAKAVNLKTDTHFVSRYSPLTDVTTLYTLTSQIGAVLRFRLSDVANSSEFTSLFDNYRLIGVRVSFRLMDNPDSSNYINSTTFAQGSNFYPQLWYCVDRDDATTPSVSTIRERASARCRVLYPNRYISVYIRNPNPLLSLPGGLQMQPPKTGWLPSSQPDTDHYGLKVVLDKMGYAGTTFTVGIEKKYYFSFHGAK